VIEATQMAAVQDASAVKSLHDVPQLLIHWSSPWEDFVTSIRPAMRRSGKPLAGEAPTRIFPFRGMAAAWALEGVLLAAAIVLPAKLASLQPYVPPVAPKYDVIYFSGDELPQTEDIGGAEKGKSGRAGGQHAQHRTQTIRVARGNSPLEKVVDAPKINLPKSDFPVANLLAIQGMPGPPPTAGLRSAVRALPQADPIAPAPSISRDQFQTSGTLATAIVAPPPEVARDKVQTLPQMTASIVAPPPSISRDKMRSIQGVNSSIVAPPPQVQREQMRAMEGVNSSVIAPPPSIQRDIAGARLPAAHNVDVVPPPVSAPVSASAVPSRISLPQSSVVAPPPSNVSRELSSYGTSKMGELHKQVVPPPVEISGGVSGRGGSTPVPGTDVVPPPPTVNGSGTVGAGRYGGGRTATLATNVVPPPPSISSGNAGRGRGPSGSSLGNSLDMNSVGAPKAGGGTGAAKTAVVVSSQPGSHVGVPGSGGVGAIAVSPSGGAKTGIGGSGNGGGLGQGSGPGSGLSGEGTGGASAGVGRGSDPASKIGMSPYPGTGGAGTTMAPVSNTPGISVSGGNTITLPSFGGSGNGADPAGPGRTHLSKGGPGITIVASSRSGGAFNFYGALKGDPVYTIYFQTTLGVAVLQYADPSSAHHVYPQELTAPEPLKADLPAGLTPARMVVACILDTTGVLRNVRMLEPGPAQMSAKVLTALPNWKFKPAFRGDLPVEVNAILGFNIDTR
jgi:hypothetical protein